MQYEFTQDWVSFRTKTWLSILNVYRNKPDLQMLEIGVYEGRATVWFLETILTHETSSILCIDPVPQASFFHNISKFKHKVRFIKEKSQNALRDHFFNKEKIDIV